MCREEATRGEITSLRSATRPGIVYGSIADRGHPAPIASLGCADLSTKLEMALVGELPPTEIDWFSSLGGPRTDVSLLPLRARLVGADLVTRVDLMSRVVAPPFVLVVLR